MPPSLGATIFSTRIVMDQRIDNIERFSGLLLDSILELSDAYILVTDSRFSILRTGPAFVDTFLPSGESPLGEDFFDLCNRVGIHSTSESFDRSLVGFLCLFLRDSRWL